tara:strand:+ start:177 stop:404 length:228 start_codon:yes stop_codon:yes gene_type:complete
MSKGTNKMTTSTKQEELLVEWHKIEDAHQHRVVQEFCELILSRGACTIVSQMEHGLKLELGTAMYRIRCVSGLGY